MKLSRQSSHYISTAQQPKIGHFFLAIGCQKSIISGSLHDFLPKTSEGEVSVTRNRSGRVLFGSIIAVLALGAAPIAHADTDDQTAGEVEPLGFGPDNVIHLIGDGMG